MTVESFFDPCTSTISYILLDRRTLDCAIIDSVLDYDVKSGRTSTASADKLVTRVGELGATVQWILETHVHADHLSAAQYLRGLLGGKVAIGSKVVQVQEIFAEIFNAQSGVSLNGGEFDRLLDDNDLIYVGELSVRAIQTPGHTPACMTYVVSDGEDTVAFVGDTLFAPDYGTARCDFPGGDASTLYRSIGKVLCLPEQTRLYMCHDYQPGGRPLEFASTVARQRASNIHVQDGTNEAAFVEMRTARDRQLSMPALLLPSIQVNMRAGLMPEAEGNGVSYMKIPVNRI
ncbi:MBL fold metallo-hydrolase [Paraburkholderia strydomiana]|uniref:MBL fold metallo-hydrolase n=1 Tax=Paraburkholderia strydomiana TaxID=1245417 RepID=UPI0038B9350B